MLVLFLTSYLTTLFHTSHPSGASPPSPFLPHNRRNHGPLPKAKGSQHRSCWLCATRGRTGPSRFPAPLRQPCPYSGPLPWIGPLPPWWCFWPQAVSWVHFLSCPSPSTDPSSGGLLTDQVSQVRSGQHYLRGGPLASHPDHTFTPNSSQTQLNSLPKPPLDVGAEQETELK